jgi:hypothetical protein
VQYDTRPSGDEASLRQRVVPKGSQWDEQGTVRSTERSSNVSLLTCHTCVVDVDESRDFLSSSDKLSSDSSIDMYNNDVGKRFMK